MAACRPKRFCEVGVEAINAILAMDPETSLVKAYMSELSPSEAEDVKFVRTVNEFSRFNSIQAMKVAAKLWTRYGLACRHKGDAVTEKVWDFLEEDVLRLAQISSIDKIDCCKNEAEWIVRQLAAVTLPRFLGARRRGFESLDNLYRVLPKTAEDWVQTVFASWVDQSSLCCVLADMAISGSPIVYANEEFFKSTEFLPRDILGKNLSVLQGPKTQVVEVERLRRALRKATTVQTVLLNYRKGGSTFNNMLTLVPLFDSDTNYRFVVGIQFNLDAMSSTQTNAFRQSPLCLKLIRLESFVKSLPTTLPVPSADDQATRSILRACLRTVAYAKVPTGQKEHYDEEEEEDDDDDSDASSKKGEDELFLERRVRSLSRNYDGPDVIVRSNGNVWITRCAWLVQWCAQTPSATSLPYEIVIPNSWNDSAATLNDLARLIDATDVSEAHVAELRREKMRSKIGGSVLDTLFGSLGTATEQRHPSQVSPAPAPEVKRRSYCEIIAGFDDDVLARLVSGCSHLTCRHSNFFNFRATKDEDPAKNSNASPPKEKKSLAALLRAAESRGNRVSKIGILKAAAAFHVHGQRPLLTSIADHESDGSESEAPPTSTEPASLRHSLLPTTPSHNLNSDDNVSSDSSTENEMTPFSPPAMSSSQRTSSVFLNLDSRRTSHETNSLKRGDSRRVSQKLSGRRQSRLSSTNRRQSNDEAERERTGGELLRSFSRRQSLLKARRATVDKGILVPFRPEADGTLRTNRRSSLAPQPRLLAQRPQSDADQEAPMKTATSLRCMQSVKKEKLANAIMKPNNTREAEIKAEMDCLRDMCGSALVDVLATPTLLADPIKFVANVRAQEEKTEGYPSWTMRTALCGARNELFAGNDDTFWVSQFMPALGDALSSHGNIGFVGVDMRAPGLPLVYVNDGFAKLVKRPRSSVIGRNCNILQQNPKGPTQNDPNQVCRIAELSAAITKHQEHLVRLKCYDGFGEQFLCVVVVSPIRMPNFQDVAYNLGFQIRLTSASALGNALFALDCLLRNLPRTTTCDDMTHQQAEEYARSNRAPDCLHDVSVPLYIASWLALDVPDASVGEDQSARRLPRWTATLELLLNSDATRVMLEDIVDSTCSIAARELFYFILEVESISLLSPTSRSPSLRKLFAENGRVSRLTPFDPKQRDDLDDPAWLDSTWLALLAWRDALFSHAARILLPILIPIVHRRLHASKSLKSKLSAQELTGPLPSSHDATARYLFFRQPTNDTTHFPTRAWASSMEATDVPIVLFRLHGDGCRRKVHVRSQNAEARRLEVKCGKTMKEIIRQLPEKVNSRKTVWTVLEVGSGVADVIVQSISELDGWTGLVVAGLDPKRREYDFKVAVRLIAVWSRCPPKTERRARFVEQGLTRRDSTVSEGKPSSRENGMTAESRSVLLDREERNKESSKARVGDEDINERINARENVHEKESVRDDEEFREAELADGNLRRHVHLTFQVAYSRVKMYEQCARQREELMRQICPIPSSLACTSTLASVPHHQRSLSSSHASTTGRRRRSDRRLCRLMGRLERELNCA